MSLLLVGTACGTKVERVLEKPSVENAKKLFAITDMNTAANAFSRLSSDRRAQWTSIFDLKASDLRRVDESIEDYCATVSALKSNDGNSPRWTQLVVLCERLDADLHTSAEEERGLLENQRAVADADNELKMLAEESKAMRKRMNSVMDYDGFIIQRLNAHRYEVANAQMVNVPTCPCFGVGDCNAAEFSRMANPPFVPSEDHGILETSEAEFSSPGRFSLRVRVKGKETQTDTAGFKREFVVLEEVRAAEDFEVAERQRTARISALTAQRAKSLRVLSESTQRLALARVEQDRNQIENLLACVSRKATACDPRNVTDATAHSAAAIALVTKPTLNAPSLPVQIEISQRDQAVDVNDPEGEGDCCDDTEAITPKSQLALVPMEEQDSVAWADLHAAEAAHLKARDRAKAANDRGYKILNVEKLPDRALPFFEYAAKADPKYGMARYSAAKCYAAKGDVVGVVRYLGEIKALGKKQGDRFATAKTDPAFSVVANDAGFQALFR